MVSKKQVFWMVWCETTRSVQVQHESSDAAVKEARRLAGLNPNKKFFVLMAVGVAEVRQPQDYEAFCDEGVPF